MSEEDKSDFFQERQKSLDVKSLPIVSSLGKGSQTYVTLAQWAASRPKREAPLRQCRGGVKLEFFRNSFNNL